VRTCAIDECPECGGIFLDAGELAHIRSEFPTEEARHAAADAYFKEVVDPLLDEQRAEDRAELERAQTVAHALRFITPSWYVPGVAAGDPGLPAVRRRLWRRRSQPPVCRPCVGGFGADAHSPRQAGRGGL